MGFLVAAVAELFDGLDNTVRIFLLGADTWPSFAERVRPHIAKMADGSGGRFEARDIERAVTSGRMHLWVIMDGLDLACVVVTELHDYPRSRAMRYIGVSGRRPLRWMHLQANIEAAAKLHFGCDRMEALHQPGHERLLRTPGWRQWHILSEKML